MILGVAALFLAVGWFWGKKSQLFEPQIKASSSVVVEKMEKVLKLVTVEATLSEIYNYKDFYTYDVFPLRKKAMLRVNAKVAAGYDFDKITITVDSTMGKVVIANMPKAEILAIDHTLDYYDIEQGLFNSFTSDDYNHINNNAKEYIKNVALQSGVIEKANEQKKEMIDMWRTILDGMGYKLEILEQNQLPEFTKQ
ncbi:MAG: DUF4230 domain-containing protein [Saprospiraceae bacterium]|nr:DUF4230 domain-containing protein [Saprospiraceae bacterium]